VLVHYSTENTPQKIEMTKTEQTSKTRVLIIDNYNRQVVAVHHHPSFTWNLFQYLCLLGASVPVVRYQAYKNVFLLTSVPKWRRVTQPQECSRYEIYIVLHYEFIQYGSYAAKNCFPNSDTELAKLTLVKSCLLLPESK
jgi:hypothetical protein